MLTPEQIKNLKEGDPIVIRTTAECVDSDGDVKVRVPYSLDRYCWIFIHSDYVSLPDNSQSSIVNSQSKYDPTSLFKKGDKVQRRTVDGRTDPDVLEGINLTVTTDEDKYGNVRVQEPNGRSIVTKSVFLELVTPVEELEPYFIYESTEEESFDIMKRDGKLHLTRNCIYYKTEINVHAELTREQALAAAEAECKRLNEEWRKEQK